MDSFRRTRSVQKMKSGDHAREHAQKLLPVLVIQKDVLLHLPPGGDVIERPRKFVVKWTRHERNLAHQSYKKQNLTLSVFQCGQCSFAARSKTYLATSCERDVL